MAIRRQSVSPRPLPPQPSAPSARGVNVGAAPTSSVREPETETLARVADAFTRARPPAEPPAVRGADSAGPAKGMSAVTLRASLPKSSFVRQPLTPEQRLRSLVTANASPSPEPAPSARQLGALIRGQIGPRSRELSALEVAQILGKPEWAAAVAELGDSVCKAGARAPHFLLAAHLARWMEGIYEGASQAEVVASFKAAMPEVAARFGDSLDAELLELLQKSYGFMPAWRHKPAAQADTADFSDWLDVPDAGALYAERLEHALSELSEVPLTMKLSDRVGTRLAKDQRFAGHNVVMVQHMLGQANPFLDAMCKAGLEVDKAEYVGIPYQQNPAVKLTIEKTFGIDVNLPERGDIDAMWSAVCAAVDRAVARHEQNGEPILVIDDGGYASKYIAQRYPDKASAFKVVEQTTRGLTEIHDLEKKGIELGFPVVNVAGSYGKRFESAQVGDAVVQAVRRVLDEVATTVSRKDVLIVGAGKVGVGVANAFQGDGSRVSIYDPYLSPARIQQLEAQGFRVITDKSEALGEKFLVVGCSGHRSIEMDDFIKMSSPVFLASSSSKRVEIDTVGLKELATDKDGQLRRILAARVNEQETWHYWTQDGRIVTTLADGLPVNFQDVNSIAPELIDHTMALMLLGAGEAVKSDGKGLVELDPLKQFELQAAMERLSTERGDKSELKIKVGETDYFGSQTDWRAIAASPATPPAVIEALVDVLTSRDHDGDRSLYRYEMGPVLLTALESPKELSDATVERVLSSGYLPHIAHLARNPELSEAQTERVLGYVEKALAWIDSGAPPIALKEGNITPPVGALFTAEGAVKTAAVGVNIPTGYVSDYSSFLGHRDDDVRAQLSAILYTHPACPQRHLDALREAVLAPHDVHTNIPVHERMTRVDPGTVLLLRNPRWTREELLELITRMHAPLMRMVPRERIPPFVLEADPFLASQLGSDAPRPGESVEEAAKRSNRQASFAYDMFDAIANHPNADEATARMARMHAGFVAEAFDDQMVLRGVKAWVEDPTGAPVPDYV